MTSPRITQLPRPLLVDAVAAAAIGDYIAISVDGDETDNSAGRVGVVGADPSVGVIVSTTIEVPCVDDVACVGDVVSPPSPARRVVTVPTRQLVAELKGCGSGDVINLVVTAASLQLSCGSRRSDIAALGRVPTMPTVPPQAWRNVVVSGCAVLSTALAAVLPAAADDPSRPAVSGVRIDGGDVVATDGARLHWVAGGIVGDSSTDDTGPALTLPVGAVGPIVDLLSVAIAASTPPKPTTVKRERGKVAAAATTVAAAVPPPPSPPLAPVVSFAVGVRNVAVRSCHDVTSSASTSATPHRVTRVVYVRRAPEPYAEWRRIVAVDVATPDAAATGVVSVTLSSTSLSSWLRSCPGDAVTLTVEAGTTPELLRLDYVVMDSTGTRCVGSGSDTLPLGGATGSGASTAPKVSTRYLRDVVVAAGAVGGDVVSMSWSGTSQLLRVTSGSGGVGSAGLRFVGVVMWMR